MRHLPASAHRRMPWKNGGGETVEVAVFPEGAGLDGFDWRVSMAGVATDGPFSIFEGVDRTLSVLTGQGLILAFADGEQVRLAPETAPYAFAADRPVSAQLIDGAITDLNVMTRRGRASHRVERLELLGSMRIDGTGDEQMLLVADAGLSLATAKGAIPLQSTDAVWLERGEGADIRGRGTCFRIAIAPA